MSRQQQHGVDPNDESLLSGPKCVVIHGALSETARDKSHVVRAEHGREQDVFEARVEVVAHAAHLLPHRFRRGPHRQPHHRSSLQIGGIDLVETANGQNL